MQKTLLIDLKASRFGWVFFILASILCGVSLALADLGVFGILGIFPVSYLCYFLSCKYLFLKTPAAIVALRCDEEAWSIRFKNGQEVDVDLDEGVSLFSSGVALLFRSKETQKQYRAVVMQDSISHDNFRQLKAKLNAQVQT